MIFSHTEHPEVIRITPKRHLDKRGFFLETYRRNTFSDAGINYDFVQENYSSSSCLTLRGLHYQIQQTQGKLVKVIFGEIFDVAVDIRKSSPFFKKWVGVNLTSKNMEMLWIPPGFAHGFFVLSDRADVIYSTTNYYHPTSERTINWNDPDLKINWPIPTGQQPTISKKDAQGTPFKNAEVFE